jgi:hypothetical protein
LYQKLLRFAARELEVGNQRNLKKGSTEKEMGKGEGSRKEEGLKTGFKK